jgi:hypothetical protein
MLPLEQAQEAWQAGEAMSLEQALAYALGDETSV